MEPVEVLKSPERIGVLDPDVLADFLAERAWLTVAELVRNRCQIVSADFADFLLRRGVIEDRGDWELVELVFPCDTDLGPAVYPER